MMTSTFSKIAALVFVSVFAAGCAADGADDDQDEQTEELGETESAQTTGCAAGYVCIYADSNFRGRHLQFRDTGCQNIGSSYGFNDKASSLKNRTSHHVKLYKNAYCGGSGITFDPGESSTTFGKFSDEASSIRIY